MRPRLNPARIGIYTLLIFFATIFLVPVYVMLASSLKTFAEVPTDLVEAARIDGANILGVYWLLAGSVKG